MEEMHQAKYEERVRSPQAFPSVPLSPNVPVLTKLEALQILFFGFVWRFHYIGMID